MYNRNKWCGFLSPACFHLASDKFSLLARGANFLGRYLHGLLFSDQTNGMLKNQRWILDSKVLFALQGGSKLKMFFLIKLKTFVTVL